MSKSGFNIIVDLQPMEELFSDEAVKRAHWALTEHYVHVMEPYVPMMYGDLRGNVEIPSESEIVYTEDYAAPVYFRSGVARTTPGTHDHWDEYAKAEHLDELAEFFKNRLMEG